MACFQPLHGWKGKDGLTMAPHKSPTGEQLTVPCRSCLGCRLDRSREWAIRCMHEAQMNKSNLFLTLTYNPEHLPEDGSLDPHHLKLFWRYLARETGQSFRYFACGEYGEKLGRPHYHACVFGLELPDQVVHSRRKHGTLMRSKILEKAWHRGHSSIGTVTWQSAAYTARYIMKKKNGQEAFDNYDTGRIDTVTGEAILRHPEFVRMSLKPGLGRTWIEKYLSDVYPHDFIVTQDGKKFAPPEYYDKVLQELDPELYEHVKHKRYEQGLLHADDNTPERLKMREEFKQRQLMRLRREYEQST